MSDWSDAGLPAIQKSNYQYSIDAGLLRSGDTTAQPNQVRQYTKNTHTYNAYFFLTQDQMAIAHQLLHDVGFSRFTITTDDGFVQDEIPVRLTKDYAVEAAGHNFFKLALTLENLPVAPPIPEPPPSVCFCPVSDLTQSTQLLPAPPGNSGFANVQKVVWDPNNSANSTFAYTSFAGLVGNIMRLYRVIVDINGNVLSNVTKDLYANSGFCHAFGIQNSSKMFLRRRQSASTADYWFGTYDFDTGVEQAIALPAWTNYDMLMSSGSSQHIIQLTNGEIWFTIFPTTGKQRLCRLNEATWAWDTLYDTTSLGSVTGTFRIVQDVVNGNVFLVRRFSGAYITRYFYKLDASGVPLALTPRYYASRDGAAPYLYGGYESGISNDFLCVVDTDGSGTINVVSFPQQSSWIDGAEITGHCNAIPMGDLTNGGYARALMAGRKQIVVLVDSSGTNYSPQICQAWA